ncbi:hypothetical protein SDC9_192339 [bioreactor metagenome]|uniref:Uncharacterized protein n=1 Tax=bioreactor metagenome TaxID=1076179 RepID=A0A645I8Z1_9ZZZZ
MARFERFLERFPREQRRLGFVRDPESRINARRAEMPAQKLHAERVQRRNIRAPKAHHLAAKPRIAPAVFRKQRAKARLDALFHLVGRRVCERNNQYLIYVYATRDQPAHALGQHGRLARARARRHEQVALARDRVKLLRFPLHSPRPPSLFSRNAALSIVRT